MLPRPIVVACLLVLAVAGCGGDDDSKKKSSSEDPAKLSQQDDTAKSNARNLVTEVETCFVDQQQYSVCKEPEGTQLPLGGGPGQVEVASAGDVDFSVVSHSESGTNFTLDKAETGETSRSCDQSGKGGCQPDGTW